VVGPFSRSLPSFSPVSDDRPFRNAMVRFHIAVGALGRIGCCHAPTICRHIRSEVPLPCKRVRRVYHVGEQNTRPFLPLRDRSITLPVYSPGFHISSTFTCPHTYRNKKKVGVLFFLQINTTLTSLFSLIAV